MHSVDHLGGFADSQFAPLVLSLPCPVSLSLPSLFLSVRRGLRSFCFSHDDCAVLATEPLAVLRTRSPEQSESAPFLSGALECADPLLHLQTLLFDVPPPLRHSLPQLNGLLFGFCGFDAIRSFEPSVVSSSQSPPVDVLKMPETIFFQCPSLVLVRHGEIFISALCRLSSSSDMLASNFSSALERVHELRDRVLSSLSSSSSHVPPMVRDYDGPPSGGEGTSNFGREGYHGHVAFLKKRIVAGDMVQTVPSHRVEVNATPAHPFNVWCAMRQNASRYSYYVELEDGFAIVGASPELLVSVSSEGVCETHPIAGTRRRGADAEADERLKRDLLADEKERAEHVMLVDLGRNDLNRVCSDVSVPRLMQVDFFSHVMHIVSSVKGRLRPGLGPLDAFKSVFPAGTVSGAPKIMACKHIYTLEKQRRGLYAGALGWIDLSGKALDFCIAIRTLLWLGPKRCFAQAGGGIVLDSNEEDEYQETLAKMAGVLAAVKKAEQNLNQQGPETIPAPESQVSQKYNAAIRSSPTMQVAAAVATASVVTKPPALVKNAVLLVDNYDSFTFNLYQLLSRQHTVNVVRNDQVTVAELVASEPTHIVLGPGPCSPSEAGICAEVIRTFEGKVPILGVCLGMEVMVEVYGAKIDVCGEIKHGKTSALLHDGKGVNAGVTQGVQVVRYHSLACFQDDLAKNAPLLQVTSVSEDSNVIMGIRHKTAAVEGVQFHPESVKTEQGALMISNFLSWRSGTWASMSGGQIPSSILQRIISTLPDRGVPEVPGRWQHEVIDMAIRLKHPGGVVAEVKRASPSKGDIASAPVDAAALASTYAACPGVCAVSILTEPHFFKGSLSDLAAARTAVESESRSSGRPRAALLRKDFIIHEAQIVEARENGADSVLLIVAVLSEARLAALIQFARKCGIEPLVEAANELELLRAVNSGSRLIGVNARDLHTFQVDVERAALLIERGRALASEVTWVGLSGVSEGHHTARYKRAGASAVVVGEHLMRTASVPAAISSLLGLAPPVRVKICGLTREQDVEASCADGADFLGFIFASTSKRVISAARAAELAAVARGRPHPPLLVGVFSGNSKSEIEAAHALVRFDVLQLCDGVNVDIAAGSCQIWRVIHVHSNSKKEDLFQRAATFRIRGERVVFDTASAAGGGTGQSFDWKLLPTSEMDEAVLAGGLRVSSVGEAVRRTGAWCLDISSGCETERPGEKNPALIRRLIREAKACSTECRPTSVVLRALVVGEGTTPNEISQLLGHAAAGDNSLSSSQIASLLTSLAMRPDLQTGALLRQTRAVFLSLARPFPVGQYIDIVGTGGDGLDTFNVSTAAALVVASLGLAVAKHGNRSSSGKSGAADLIEALGMSLDASANEELLAKHNFGFLFAPEHHPAMRSVRQVRRDLGFRTIFNLLGPLISPARPRYMVVGAATPLLVEQLARALDVESALVVCSDSGLDELVAFGGASVALVRPGGRVDLYHWASVAAEAGVEELSSLDPLLGGSPAANASRCLALFANPDSDKTGRDFVAMNAGAALWISGRADSLKTGTSMAIAALRDGTTNKWFQNVMIKK